MSIQLIGFLLLALCFVTLAVGLMKIANQKA